MFREFEEDDYDLLPEPVKLMYSRDEYMWFSDEEKARLIQTVCEPEVEA